MAAHLEACRHAVQFVKETFDRSTSWLEEEDASFTPAQGALSAMEQVAHVAHTVDWFLEGAFDPKGFDMDFEAIEKQIRAVPTLAAARRWFDESVQRLLDALDERGADAWGEPIQQGPVLGGMPRTSIVNALADHTAHHRGALTVYARLCGKVAPMPYMDA